MTIDLSVHVLYLEHFSGAFICFLLACLYTLENMLGGLPGEKISSPQVSVV